MNIGFLYGRTYPPGAGGSVHGYQLARGLVDRGHNLFSWYHGDSDHPFITHYRGRELISFLRKIDILYVRMNWDVRTKFLWLRRLSLGRLPVVWELNGLPEEIIYLGGTEADAMAATAGLRRLGRSVDAGIGVTDRVTDYLREEVGVRRGHTIPNGSDPDLFRPSQKHGNAAAPLKVVWIGSAGYSWHDIQGMLNAARVLAKRHANVQFTIYGSRDRMPTGSPSNVVFAGHVPYLELGEYLADADVGLQLFRSLKGVVKGGSPLKLFDYMASGLAVVAQNSGQTGKVISATEAGLFTSGEPEDVVEKLLLLEQDRELCRRLGSNGREAVVEYYNWDRVAKETEDVLVTVVNGKVSRR